MLEMEKFCIHHKAYQVAPSVNHQCQGHSVLLDMDSQVHFGMVHSELGDSMDLVTAWAAIEVRQDE